MNRFFLKINFKFYNRPGTTSRYAVRVRVVAGCTPTHVFMHNLLKFESPRAARARLYLRARHYMYLKVVQLY